MSLKQNTSDSIRRLLVSTVRGKLQSYKPETDYMPFHHNLLGRDRYALFSFIHSMNTTLGTSIWEQIAVLIARDNGYQAERQYILHGSIDSNTESLIENIYNSLRNGSGSPDVLSETQRLRNSIQNGPSEKHPDSVVDFFMIKDQEENYFDITAAKPNKKEFAALKHKLLVWKALRLSQGKETKISARIALPYNPYYPEPYSRWTLSGIYDKDNYEILVGADFWKWVANDDIYDELLHIFEEAGKQIRDEIDNRFKTFF